MHQSNNFGCCTTGNQFHERCQYQFPLSDCKAICDHDSNCKGYVGYTLYDKEYCQIATTSECKFGGSKTDIGITGDLGGSCGNWYDGCYIKTTTGLDYLDKKLIH